MVVKFSLHFHQVFNEFSTCSPSSQCAPQHIPNCSLLYPHILCLISTLVTYIASPRGEIIRYLFWDYQKLDFLIFYDGAIEEGAHPKRKERKIWGFPQLINNMNHNIYYHEIILVSYQGCNSLNTKLVLDS
jgi:hypothetical protein